MGSNQGKLLLYFTYFLNFLECIKGQQPLMIAAMKSKIIEVIILSVTWLWASAKKIKCQSTASVRLLNTQTPWTENDFASQSIKMAPESFWYFKNEGSEGYTWGPFFCTCPFVKLNQKRRMPPYKGDQ